jgi:hypothetical protein
METNGKQIMHANGINTLVSLKCCQSKKTDASMYVLVLKMNYLCRLKKNPCLYAYYSRIWHRHKQ